MRKIAIFQALREIFSSQFLEEGSKMIKSYGVKSCLARMSLTLG
jgi:hypothetical protein